MSNTMPRSSNILAPPPPISTTNYGTEHFITITNDSKVSLSSASSSSSSSSIVEIPAKIPMHPRTKKLLFFIGFGILLVAAIVTLTVVFSLNKKSNDQSTCIVDDDFGNYGGADDPMREKELGKLLSVQISFRHGARTPLDYPSYDPNSNLSIWNEIGTGQLTIYGKQLVYRYGQLLRQRYAKFLERVPLRNIDAQTSPVRRVAESTLSVVAGMFPPNGSLQIWSNPASVPLASQWQPIGLSMTEIAHAYALGDEPSCPRATQIKSQIDTNSLPAAQELMSENQDFVRRIVEQFGEDYNKWGKISGFYDPLYSEKVFLGNEFVMPEKLQATGVGDEDQIWAHLRVFNSFNYGLSRYLPQEYVRIKGGPFVANMLQNIRNDLEYKNTKDGDQQEQEERFIHLMGSHDTTISNALVFLDFYREQPRYGSGIVAEVRAHPQTGIPMVHLYYSNSTATINGDQPYDCTKKLFEIHPLPLNESATFRNHCTDIICPLDTFINALKPLLPENIEQECQAK